jgi:hypothetical protein
VISVFVFSDFYAKIKSACKCKKMVFLMVKNRSGFTVSLVYSLISVVDSRAAPIKLNIDASL